MKRGRQKINNNGNKPGGKKIQNKACI